MTDRSYDQTRAIVSARWCENMCEIISVCCCCWTLNGYQNIFSRNQFHVKPKRKISLVIHKSFHCQAKNQKSDSIYTEKRLNNFSVSAWYEWIWWFAPWDSFDSLSWKVFGGRVKLEHFQCQSLGKFLTSIEQYSVEVSLIKTMEVITYQRPSLEVNHSQFKSRACVD